MPNDGGNGDGDCMFASRFFSRFFDLLYFHVAVCLHNGIIFDRTGERGRKREREIEM